MADIQQQRFGELTVRIDRSTCIGSANCLKLAPEAFELDDETIIRFKVGARSIEAERLIEACRVCPVEALIVVDAQGGQLVP
jgi:ferredoxin